MLKIVLFDRPHLLTTPTNTLCIHSGLIVHAHGKGHHIIDCLSLCICMSMHVSCSAVSGYVFERALILFISGMSIHVNLAFNNACALVI